MIVYNYDADLEVSDTCVRSSLLSWVWVEYTSLWNFVPNSGLMKCCFGVSITQRCYQLTPERRTLDSVTKWAVISQRCVASTLVVVVCRILLNEGLKHWVRMCNINCTSRNSVDKWINFIRNPIKRNSFVPVSVEVVGRHRVAGVNSYRLRPVRGRWPIWHELFLAAVQRLAADELIGHVTVLSADDRHTGLQGLRRVTTPIQHKGKMSVLSCSLCSFADEIWITEAFISPRSKQSRPSRCLYHIAVIVIDIFGVILPFFSLFVTGYWYFNGLGITWLCRFSD